jgi:hypothetical protein
LPTPTYTPLATVTLGSSASSVTFSNIPATYRDLILVSATTNSNTGAQDAFLRYNGDTGSNYNLVYADISNNGNIISSSLSSVNYQYHFYNYSGTSSTINTCIVQLMDYSATDKHKTVLHRFGSANNMIGMYASRWASTAAINSVQLYTFGGPTFQTGSTFSLYGVIA